MTVYPLETYSTSTQPLSESDAAYLGQALQEVAEFRISRPLAGGGYELDPGQYIGVLPMPSGSVIEIAPRDIPVDNVTRMLLLAYDIPQRLPAASLEAPLRSIDAVIDLILAAFCERAEQRIKQGLRRDYVELADNLPYVRGKILFAEDLRHNAVLRQRTYCQYTELQWDVPDNQVIRFVARRAMLFVRSPLILARLQWIDQVMAEVRPSRFTSDQVRRFSYHRINSPYRPVHDLSRLILDGVSIAETAGDTLFPGFLYDMNKVFEAFVANALAKRLAQDDGIGGRLILSRPKARQLYLGHGADGTQLSELRPDLSVRRGDQLIAVGDCKFKVDPSGTDYQQVLAYGVAGGTRRAFIVRPRARGFSAPDADVKLSGPLLPEGVIVRDFPIDLSGGDAQLEDSLDVLADGVRLWSLGLSDAAAFSPA